MTDVAIIQLNGQGDTYIFFLPVDVYNWMFEVKSGLYRVPKDLQESLAPFVDDGDELDEEQEASFTADNDVALFLSEVVTSFYSVREAMRHSQNSGFNIVAEYSGYIY